MDLLSRSLSHLLKHPLRSFLAILGIASAIAGIIAIIAVESSWQESVKSSYERLFGVNVIRVSPLLPAHTKANRRRLLLDDATAIKQQCSAISSVGVMRGPVGLDIKADAVHSSLNCYQVSSEYLNAVGWRTEVIANRKVNPQGCWISPCAVERLFGKFTDQLPATVRVAGRVLPLNGIAQVQPEIDNSGEGYFFIPLDNNPAFAGAVEVWIAAKSDDVWRAASQIDQLMNARLGVRERVEFADGAWKEIAELNRGRARLRLFTTVALVILILVAVLGISSTLLANVEERVKETALYRALGARSRQIALEVYLESLLLCLVGGMIGICVAYVCMSVISNWLSVNTNPGFWGSSVGFSNQSASPASLSPKLVFAGMTICLAASLAAAWFPSSIARSNDIARSLAITSASNNKLGRIMVLSQVTMGAASAIIMLAIYAGLSKASIETLQHQSKSNIIQLTRLEQDRELAKLWTDQMLLKQIAEDGTNLYSVSRLWVPQEGCVVKRNRVVLQAWPLGVDQGTVDQYMPDKAVILAGREIQIGDNESKNPVCVIGEGLANELFGTESAIGKTIRVNGMPFSIIGIMKHFMWTSRVEEELNRKKTYTYDKYVVLPNSSIPNQWYGLRSISFNFADRLEPLQAQSIIEKVLRARTGTNGDLGNYLINRAKIHHQLRSSATKLTLNATLLGSISFWIALVGLANLLFITFQGRTREIGLLRALGATRRRIIYSGLAEALGTVIIGCASGLLLASIISSALGRIVNLPIALPADWILVVFLCMLLASTIASLLPTLQAAMVDPSTAIRYE